MLTAHQKDEFNALLPGKSTEQGATRRSRSAHHGANRDQNLGRGFARWGS